jgi:hypothetical protein
MLNFLAPLLGALIGAGAAIGAQTLSQRSSMKSAQRKERVDLVANLWSACDRLWRATCSLNFTIYELSASRQAGFRDLLADLDERRLSEIAEKRSAETDAAFVTAQMRFLQPSLAPAAEMLRSASTRHKAEEHGRYEADRQAALDVFEDVARRTLN